MSTKNQISLQIPPAVLAEATEKLQDVRTLLAPYLQALAPGEKKSIFKMGDKTVAKVQKVEDYTETNPEFTPSYMDKPEFKKDVAVVTDLSPLRNLSVQLASDLSDTITIAGKGIIGCITLLWFCERSFQQRCSDCNAYLRRPERQIH